MSIQSSTLSFSTTLRDFCSSREELRERCAQINRGKNRERKYLSLFAQLGKVFQGTLREREFERATSHLKTVLGALPESLQSRPKVCGELIETAFFWTVHRYRQCEETSDTAALERIVGIWRQHVRHLKHQIKSHDKSPEVEFLWGKIRAIAEFPLLKTAAPEVAKEAKKCASFALQKLGIRSFYERSSKRRGFYPILSIDGGGIRGILPAKVLAKMEEISGKPISKLFSLIGGTSTGGILALGLTKPHPEEPETPEYRAADLLALYVQEHAQIFRSNPGYRENTSQLSLASKVNEAINNPRYQTPLLFKERFQEAPLSSALADVVVTANTLDSVFFKAGTVVASGLSLVASVFSGLFTANPWPIFSHDSLPKKVHLFTKQGLRSVSYSPKESLERGKLSKAAGGFFMADVARVTSAAPTYFPPVRYRGEFFVDGGVLQNNPTIPSILEALDRGYKKKELFVVSLGTGTDSGCEKETSDLFQSLWFETTQSDWQIERTMIEEMEFGAYHRLQHSFKEKAPGLDDTSPEAIALLEKAADELVEENEDYLEEICKILC